MKIIGKIFDVFEETLIIIMLGYMAIMNFLNVVFRYCFATSFSFTEELTVTVFVWVTMLGVAAGFKKCAHLGMSFIVDQFHGKTKAMFFAFSILCSTVFTLILLVYGIEMVQGQMAMGSTTPVLQMPQAVQGLSIPVGAVFILIRLAQSGYQGIKALWNEGKESNEGGTVA